MVLSGLPGSGKSTVAQALRGRVDAVAVQSDVVRKQLFPVPSYTSEESAWVFAVINRVIERLLCRGVPVVLDATNLLERHRRQVAGIAGRCHARRLMVWVEASEQEIRRRLAARHSGGRAAYDVSDATIAVYEQLRGRVEPIRERHTVIRTDRELEPQIDRLVRMIEASPTARPARQAEHIRRADGRE